MSSVLNEPTGRTIPTISEVAGALDVDPDQIMAEIRKLQRTNISREAGILARIMDVLELDPGDHPALAVYAVQAIVDELAADRPTPVDPASVKVGDVVEVEADDESWMVRGRVASTDPGSAYPFALTVPDMSGSWVRVQDTTVRVIKAQPEPDPAAVKALAVEICEVRDHRNWGDDSDETLARELIRRGVYVEVPE